MKNLRLINAFDYTLDEILKFNSINESMLVQSEDKEIFTKKACKPKSIP